MEWLLIVSLCIAGLVLICNIALLLFPHHRLLNWLTLPIRIRMAAHHFHVSVKYARETLILVDRFERSEIDEIEFAHRMMSLDRDYRQGKEPV